MSYDIRKNDEGDTIVMPLELPIFNSSTNDLGRQAEVCLASFLRHASVCDWIEDNLNLEDEVTLEEYGSELSQASSQLAALFMTLAGIADNMRIDIMREIWDVPNEL